MNTYVVLIRGINVGGKNKVSMAELKIRLKEVGYVDVNTYINSGNVIVSSNKTADQIRTEVESQLPKWFTLDNEIIKVLVLGKDTLKAVIENKPARFGDEPSVYHTDVIFLIGIDTEQAFAVFDPRDGVDYVWKGKEVIYSQRLSAERTKSRLSKIMISPLYKSMTIRNWNTVMKLYEITHHL